MQELEVVTELVAAEAMVGVRVGVNLSSSHQETPCNDHFRTHRCSKCAALSAFAAHNNRFDRQEKMMFGSAPGSRPLQHSLYLH